MSVKVGVGLCVCVCFVLFDRFHKNMWHWSKDLVEENGSLEGEREKKTQMQQLGGSYSSLGM